jgi:hypothetical protein
MKFKFYLPMLLGTLLPLSGHAATDGRPGLHSTGQIFIRLQFFQSVQVSNLKDIELEVDDDMLRNGIETTQEFCIRGSKNGYYRLVANSDRGGSTPFSLHGDSGENVNFSLYFNGDMRSNVLEPMTPGIPSQNYQVQSNGVDCNGEDNAAIAIQIPAEQLRDKSDQIFSGYLNLTVAIE